MAEYPYIRWTLIHPSGRSMDLDAPNRATAEAVAAKFWDIAAEDVISRYRYTVLGPKQSPKGTHPPITPEMRQRMSDGARKSNQRRRLAPIGAHR